MLTYMQHLSETMHFFRVLQSVNKLHNKEEIKLYK